MRIGIFGGSFDPIHHGHLILARDAAEQLGLDQVRFVPAAVSPFKSADATTPATDRRAMLQAALDGGGSEFILDDRELGRDGPSYAVVTAEELATEFPGADLVYLIGADNVADLAQWHRWNRLRQLVRFAVFAREGCVVPGCDFPILPRRVEISATEIRNRVATGRPIRYLVPEAVAEYIARHALYQTPSKL